MRLPAGARLAAAAALVIAHAAEAQYGRIPPTAIDPAALTIDEPKHLGRALDPAIALRDQQGRSLRLGELFGKPLILLLSYYRCDGSCPTQNRKMAETLLTAGRVRAGRDYRVLTVSFDGADDDRQLPRFTQLLNLPEEAQAGWRLAIAPDPEERARLLDTVGFRFFWSARDRVFLHPNVFVVVNAEGRIARYLYGVSIGPRDVELAVTEANAGRIANAAQAIDYLTGLCFSYNFSEGRYTLNYPLFIAMASLAFGAGLVVFSFTVYRRKKPRRRVHA
jgi:protein SCO1/2